MTNKQFTSYLIAAVVALPFFSSCSKDDKEVDNVIITTGLYVLNEGAMNSNNSTITYFDFATGLASTDLFDQKNNRKLGDTGQDMIQYGSKIYIAVHGSATLEVVNSTTFKSIKTLDLVDANNNKIGPRSLTKANGKVYIVLWNGYVAQMDTTSLSIEKQVKVGSYPDKSVITNNKLFVTNTGAYSAVFDSTVSVVNLTTFTEERKIKVNLNPSGNICADTQGDVYVLSMGNYFNIPGKLQRIEAGSYNVSDVAVNDVKGFSVFNNKAYIYTFNYDANYHAANIKLQVYDLINEKLINGSLTNTTIENTPYTVAVNPANNDIYLGSTDYKNIGKVYCFDQTGNFKYSFNAGISPSKILFLLK